MEKQTASPLSPLVAEEFWTRGEDARAAEAGAQPETIEDWSASRSAADAVISALAGSDNRELKPRRALCCIGVDKPGVGHVHAADCPTRRPPTVPGKPYVAGEVPQTLRNFVGSDAPAQEGWKASGMPERLLTAARRLAEHAIQTFRVGEENIFLCRECRAAAKYGSWLQHGAKCRVGAVLVIVDEIRAAIVEAREARVRSFEQWQRSGAAAGSQSNEKEAAPGEETGGAGEGIRSRCPGDRMKCKSCGTVGGYLWTFVGQEPCPNVDHTHRALRLTEDFESDGEMRWIYEHHCASQGGAQ